MGEGCRVKGQGRFGGWGSDRAGRVERLTRVALPAAGLWGVGSAGQAREAREARERWGRSWWGLVGRVRLEGILGRWRGGGVSGSSREVWWGELRTACRCCGPGLEDGQRGVNFFLNFIRLMTRHLQSRERIVLDNVIRSRVV